MVGSDDKTTPRPVPTEFQAENIRRLIMLGIGILFAIVFAAVSPVQGTMDRLAQVNCNVHHGPCLQKLQGTEVLLDINPKPVKAMVDLMFTVTLNGNQGSSEPFIDLDMPGMKMGPNRVFLKSQGKGIYSGIGTIVRCPSGERIWKATITVPDQGFVEFIFDVIY
jgi:hypothetical protein